RRPRRRCRRRPRSPRQHQDCPIVGRTSMSTAAILRRFDNLNVWKKHGKRAPHKPLLVLYALGRWQRGLTDVGFREAEKDLKELLREFGPPRKSDHPEEPFWRLQYDDVWTVHAAEGLALKAG